MATQAILTSFTLSDQAKEILRGRKSFYVRSRLIQHSGTPSKMDSPAILLEDIIAGEVIDFSPENVSDKTLFTVDLRPDTTFITDFYAIRKSSGLKDLVQGALKAVVASGATKIKTSSGIVGLLVVAGAEIAKLLLGKPGKKATKPKLLARAILTGQMMGDRDEHMLVLEAVQPIFFDRIKRENKKLDILETIDRYLKEGTPIATLVFTTSGG